MSYTCRDVIDALARPTDGSLDRDADDHLAGCAACRQRATDADRVTAALRARIPELDDLSRERVLVEMSPAVDEIARTFAKESRRPSWATGGRRIWIPLAAVAAVAATFGVWLGRNETRAVAPQARIEQSLLRPYVVSGGSSEEAATTLLAGRFATLDVPRGQLVRASVDNDRDLRIGVVGPARLAVDAAPGVPALTLASGTLLIDSRGRSVSVRAGQLALHAENALFGVQVTDQTAVVFVDRGEIVLDGHGVGAGEWVGPVAARSQTIVIELRAQGNAIAPPDDHGGVLEIAGDARIVTEAGETIGSAPVWARMPAGNVTLVAVAGTEHRTPIEIHEGTVSHIAAGEARPPEATSAPAAPVPQPAPIAPAAKPPTTRAVSKAIAHPATAMPALPMTTKPAPKIVSREPARAIAAVEPPKVEATQSHTVTSVDTTTASQLYAQAETALGTSDRGRAAVLWTELVARFPGSSQAASALYDLAGLARARGDYAAAQAALARLMSGAPPAALREPSAYLSCRLHVDAGEPTAAVACFRTFRERFASSPHDAEVLGWLAGHAEESGGCTAAQALADEYARRYPKGPFAARARACRVAR